MLKRSPGSPAVLLVLPLLVLVGCASKPVLMEPGSHPATLPPAPPPESTGGAIYQAGYDLRLFDDLKARRIGDTLTVRLRERTQASKSASTDASKNSSLDTGVPIIAGDTITRNGDEILNFEWETGQDFSGEGSSSQSNSLDGDITVTVSEVLPNGNLLVSGEKWLTLNQGEEYIQISGIVRPRDILPDNSVPSFKVADARIAYSGKGAVAAANKPGWFSRFFLSPIWPF